MELDDKWIRSVLLTAWDSVSMVCAHSPRKTVYMLHKKGLLHSFRDCRTAIQILRDEYPALCIDDDGYLNSVTFEGF